jgi:hypothetical protein
MSKRLYDLVDGYADSQGIKRSAVVVQALEQFFGMEKKIVSPSEFARTRNILPTTSFHAPETTMMQETSENSHGDSIIRPSTMSDGGSNSVKTPTRYQSGTKRKSSN